MEIKITYEEVKAQHPDFMEQLVGKINTSNSKDKNKHPKDYEWSYTYGVAIKSFKLGDMLLETKQDEKSQNGVLAGKLNSIIGLCLTISAGRTKRYIAINDKPEDFPKLFVDKFSDIHKKDIEAQSKEEDRLNKLTPEERDREIQENLNDLTDMGGFFGFKRGANGIEPIAIKQPIDYDLDDILDKIGRVGMDGLTTGEKRFLEENSK